MFLQTYQRKSKKYLITRNEHNRDIERASELNFKEKAVGWPRLKWFNQVLEDSKKRGKSW
jgi:hypothetical protein